MSAKQSPEQIERRKRQNRINQRTYRKQATAKLLTASEDGYGVADIIPIHTPSSVSPDKALIHSPTDSFTITACSLAPRGAYERANAFKKAAYQSYMMGSPKADHLLTLIKLNVHRALAENMAALGMDMTWMNPDAISPFCTSKPWAATIGRVIPVHLQPTNIQCTIPHHPWLDFFPHPRMRDQLIAAGNWFDDEQLCTDIMGFWSDNKDNPGLMIWGNPWEVGNWELSEGFLRKWGWAVRGCPELIKSTNHWRAMRGEKSLSMRDVT
ncbi:bZIP transcription factor [Aspergillus ibericus CBS 121593]|uniref:BZIP domain-containing protein n=1 Tax=Aspergillus ibericus CBS 121593 TaxID=1448316 RepID=A0A395GPY7_9EURO|nr:hypothetical protein BO80DRAFT_367194 [Aspergillus ibericus CBS 121593]RAK96113.1 hypothetical protein BO80DRAFT_367194 [Aspergillus ibericus CBS 121593]